MFGGISLKIPYSGAVFALFGFRRRIGRRKTPLSLRGSSWQSSGSSSVHTLIRPRRRISRLPGTSARGLPWPVFRGNNEKAHPDDLLRRRTSGARSDGRRSSLSRPLQMQSRKGKTGAYNNAPKNGDSPCNTASETEKRNSSSSTSINTSAVADMRGSATGYLYTDSLDIRGRGHSPRKNRRP